MPEFTIENFWKTESIGIEDPLEDKSQDEKAMENFDNSVDFKNGRYEVKWPRKPNATEPPRNFALAFGRLQSLMKRMAGKPQVKLKYDETIRNQEKMGIIERVPNAGPDGTAQRAHYLPHHCVIKPGKTTTKVCIMYDASAKSSKEQKSLNECLLRGPVLLPDLAGLRLRFRMHDIAIVSDIEKAFLQVGLAEADRDTTRFLWWDDLNGPCTKDNLVTYRFCRIPFGVISSPFLLSATINTHLKRTDNEIAKMILGNTYVDNVIVGVNTIDEAKRIYDQTKQVFTQASLNLREWASHNSDFLSHIPEVDKVSETIMTVLGMQWCTPTDQISLVGHDVEHVIVRTKRQMLQIVSKFFDPMGLLSPILLQPKILIQNLWKLKCDWDDILPTEILNKWKEVTGDR